MISHDRCSTSPQQQTKARQNGLMIVAATLSIHHCLQSRLVRHILGTSTTTPPWKCSRPIQLMKAKAAVSNHMKCLHHKLQYLHGSLVAHKLRLVGTSE